MPGGVCAVLDYEVEIMAEYVAEMAMRVVLPETPVTVAFRKFVSQILTSTRLPSTTILLGMNYLAKRVNTLKHLGRTFKTNEGEVWRLLTVSLLLGSKFLDDNTFQNRSWSEVSGIPVQELNRMETEWLVHMHWSLYVNLDESGDYNAWLSNWKDGGKRRRESKWLITICLKSLLASDSSHWSHLCARIPRLQQSRNKFRPRENSWQGQYQNTWPTDPLTPPDSGYGTPKYLNSAASLNSRYNDWFGSAVSSGYTHNRNYPCVKHVFSSRQCMASLQKPAHYFHHNPYGQPVVG
ncbi:hypothetical protein PG994_006647 [Apiospora phragmitis]|uniref:Cyclin-like protein n=1 Tax=Apiospora phragmitis TaxID=2905665 RepID=A0ABR1VFL9_9PEZI